MTGLRSRLGVPALLLAGAAVAVASCQGARTTYDGFYVEVSAPKGMALDQVALWVVAGTGAGREVTPRDPDQTGRYRFDLGGRDLSAEPWRVKLVPGQRFPGPVQVVALGLRGGAAVGRALAQGDVTAKEAIQMVLAAPPSGCDGDGDGFPDCGKDGCCAAGETLGDCNDGEARATPVGFEDECTRCGFGESLAGDAIDDDCSGTPARCRDEDADGARDCLPTWCGAESAGSPACGEVARSLDCDTRQASVFPGAPERCDGMDNNCEGTTDEGVTLVDWDGVTRRRVGEECGTGRCAGGVVECDGATGQPRCSTDFLKADQEDCTDEEGVDENCNGAANDPAKDGCSLGDLDGDGVPDVLEDRLCPNNPVARFHAEVFPEVEGGPRHPGQEPCCPGAAPGTAPPACDRDCDGTVTACAAGDQDGDGYVAGADTDCDDADPDVNAGAPERCGDGKDQDCKGGDLPCAGLADGDEDGYSAAGGDCDDADPDVHPTAAERCNKVDDDCDGYVDEGNPEAADAPCGSDVGDCAFGTSVCVHEEGEAPVVACVGDVKPAPERCDDQDNDCDGDTDEAFGYDSRTGASCADPEDRGACGELPRVGQGCDGIGECGPGVVVCATPDRATCTSNPDWPSSVVSDEICNDKDDDCDGDTDESLTSVEQSNCATTGVCLDKPSIRALCGKGAWTCDYTLVPGWEADDEATCDGKDNDCDGDTDEPFTYSDAVHPEPVKKGAGCGTGACADGVVDCNAEGTGLICDTTQQQKAESCDGLDNDCDGLTDEDFRLGDLPVWVDPTDIFQGHPACTGAGECAREAGQVECIDLRTAGCSTNPGGSQHLDVTETCNNRDDDCDGTTDEGLTNVLDSTCRRVGVCGAGVAQIKAVCGAGAWSCDYRTVPSWEEGAEATCDAKDNDCDGPTDEDFPFADWDGSPRSKGAPCGTGACAGGAVQCTTDRTGLECSKASLASGEVCDHADNDCDGTVDEGQVYGGVGPGQPCTGVGACARQPGVVECHPDTKVAVCSTNPDGSGSLAGIEACNGLDEDCDGTPDDGLGIASADCPCRKVGVCDPADVGAHCVDADWICDYTKVTGYQSPLETSCDAKDNDCDGQTDEDFTMLDWNGEVRSKGQDCGTGRCADGTVRCKADVTGLECSTASQQAAEACDGVDQDCDGQTDEGTDPLCADVLACTNDVCRAGACRHDVLPGFCLVGGTCYGNQAPNPANPCQVCDSALSSAAWSDRPDTTPCNADANGCTRDDACKSGTCTAGTAVSCPSPNAPCKEGFCVSLSANSSTCDERAANNGAACADGNPCTHTDKCQVGTCGGTSYSCEDGKTCTTDACDGAGGCTHTIVDGCLIAGTCRAGGAENPDNPCQVCDTATSRTTWTSRSNDTLCEDGNPCTIGDKCMSGSCAAGVQRNCQDGNPCTLDQCDPAGSPADPCVHPVNTGGGCDDVEACTYTDLCQGSGVCEGTAYTCEPLAFCYTVNCTGIAPPAQCTAQSLQAGYCFIDTLCVGEGQQKPDNECKVCSTANSKSSWTNRTGACDDGSSCTANDTCAGGACLPGTFTCVQPNPDCTVTQCGCAGTGGSATCDPLTASACDGTTATGTCRCGAGDACPAGQFCCADGTPGGFKCCPTGACGC